VVLLAVTSLNATVTELYRRCSKANLDKSELYSKASNVPSGNVYHECPPTGCTGTARAARTRDGAGTSTVRGAGRSSDFASSGKTLIVRPVTLDPHAPLVANPTDTHIRVEIGREL